MRERDVTVTHGRGEPGGRETLIPPGLRRERKGRGSTIGRVSKRPVKAPERLGGGTKEGTRRMKR